METVIDQAGRIVLPKPMRDALGLLPGTKVDIWACTGGANQQWQAIGSTLVNPASGKCLDDPRFNTTAGTQLEIYTCNGGRNQQWQLP